MRITVYYIASRDLLNLLFYTLQDNMLKGSITHSGLDTSTLIINPESAPRVLPIGQYDIGIFSVEASSSQMTRLHDIDKKLTSIEEKVVLFEFLWLNPFLSPMLVCFVKQISNKHAIFEFQISRPECITTGQAFLTGKATI